MKFYLVKTNILIKLLATSNTMPALNSTDGKTIEAEVDNKAGHASTGGLILTLCNENYPNGLFWRCVVWKLREFKL